MSRTLRRLSRLLLAGLLVAPPGVPLALAAPEGEQVAHGSAEFQRDGSLTLIRASDGAIINYDSFDILSNESVEFIQPDASSRVLNRVLSFDATQIDGSLVANGIVYIVNPVGVFFGGEAIVDVGGLVAASGSLSDEDFVAGVDHFTGLSGSIENRGEIRADSVALVGRRVANFGSILSTDGVIALVAGDDVVLTRRDGHLLVRVDGPAEDPGTAGIEQAGVVDAEHGDVSLTTGDFYSLAINHEGISRGGDVQLSGGAGGLVRVSGALDASDTGTGASGGSVRVLGDRVALLGADVDASGDAGGGEILIGGAARGGDGVPTAHRTVVDAETSLRADALGRGDGGDVIVRADEAAAFYGQISARGGARGGDGGFAEVSAPVLEARGGVDLHAPRGENGTLLYDPQDIEIVGGNADGADSPDLSADVLETDGGALGEVLFGDVGTGANPFVIYESEIEGTDANIVLEAENSITVSGTFDNDADGAGGDDPGTNVVLIQPGNSLTLQTRNDPGDETGSGETPGIDLTDGGNLAGLEWKTVGGSITIATGDDGNGGGGGGAAADIAAGTLSAQGAAVTVRTTNGAIDIGQVDTSALANSSGNAGNIRITAGGTNGIDVGDLAAVGADGATTFGGPQGDGGDVTLTTVDGAITVGAIDSSGGSGEGNGGGGGTVSIRASGVGGVDVSGDIDSSAGDRTASATQNGNGGAGGSVTLSTVEGAISLFGVNASGGDGDLRAGGAGPILINAGGDTDMGQTPGDVTLGGVLSTHVGTGMLDPIVGSASVTVIAAESIDTAAPGTHIDADANVVLVGKTIGVSRPIEVAGGASADGRLSFGADHDADVLVDTDTFDELFVQQNLADGTLHVARADGGGTLIDVVGVPGAGGSAGTSTITEIDTTDADLGLIYLLNETDGNLVVPSGSSVFGSLGVLQASGDVVLGTGSDPAVEMVAGPGGEPVGLTLAADIDGNGQGSVDHDGGAGPHVVSNGDVTLSGVSVGAGTPGAPLVIEGGGDAVGALALRLGGDANVDVVGEQAFDVVTVAQQEVGGDVSLDQVGGDRVRIVGTPASGSDPGTSTVVQVDTTGNDLAFGYSLEQAVADGADPDMQILTGAVTLGGSGLFSGTGDLVLGDAAGLAIDMTGGTVLALEADRNLDGDGAIRNGAPGVEVSVDGAQLMLFAGNGIGTPDDPIVTHDVAQVGAEVRDEGGIYLRNTGSPELVVDQTSAPQLGGAIQRARGLLVLSGPGDVELVNEGGDIAIRSTIRTADTEGDARIEAAADGGVIYFDSDPDLFETLVLTGGSQEWRSPVVVRQDSLLVGDDLTFLGAIDSESTDVDPEAVPADLRIVTAGSVTFGDGQGADGIGATNPLASLRIEQEAPIFDPQTGLLTRSEGNIVIDGETVATTGSQLFGNAVVLNQDTSFVATTDAPNFTGDAVRFVFSLDGPGAASIEAGAGDVSFGTDVGGLAPLEGLSVRFTGDEPGSIAFIGTETVATGAGGIWLNPDGRDDVPAVATIYKTGIPSLLNPPDNGFPNPPKPATSVGPLTFATAGDFVVGHDEKLSVADTLRIQAVHAEAGDLSAFKLKVESDSYTILGREPGLVLLAGGGEQMDTGVDIVGNSLSFSAHPVWDGVGGVPTFFSQSGGVDTTGTLEEFNLRLIDTNGGKVSLADFSRPDGTQLDLTGNGPVGIGNPATQNVLDGDRVAMLIGPRPSGTRADTTSDLSAEAVLGYLECADLGGGAPAGCPHAAAPGDRVLASPRARELALAYRDLGAEAEAPARDALRDALSAPGVRSPGGAVDGATLRRTVESRPRSEAAVAYLDRRDEILTELRLMNLSEATAVEVQRTLLSRWADALALPGLDATALGRAIGSSRDGLVL